MRIGVDYYPEHWDRTLWKADADLMKETGVKLVRLAEFAWCRMEPEEGRFTFDWLDDAVKMFAERGIGVVLCTPTSCPPLWLYEKYRDSVMVEKDGVPTRIGVRGHRCINHPNVREHCERIIEEMTRHYAGNPAVIAWQIDNELEAYQCYCGTCGAKFRGWLRQKYGSLDEINKAYGNVVWSGEYSSWEQIRLPFGHYPEAWMNPAFMLDYNRFASDNMIEFSSWQAALIRKNCPDSGGSGGMLHACIPPGYDARRETPAFLGDGGTQRRHGLLGANGQDAGARDDQRIRPAGFCPRRGHGGVLPLADREYRGGNALARPDRPQQRAGAALPGIRGAVQGSRAAGRVAGRGEPGRRGDSAVL